MADIDFGGSPADPALVPLATATYLIALEDTGVGTEPLVARVVATSEIAPLNSPTFTGTVTGITAAMVGAPSGSGTSSGTNTGDQTITLTGEVTGSGTGSFAATVTNSAVIGKVLTGFTSGAGTVAATDTILQAVQKLDGNVALKAPLASPVLTGVPEAPTAANGTNTTQIATTAFVLANAGSDWTYVALAADYTTTATTQSGSGLLFAPPVSSAIEFEAILLVGTSIDGNAPRPGMTWPSAGVVVSGGWFAIPTNNTTIGGNVTSAAVGNMNVAPTSNPSGGYSTAYYASVRGLFVTGPSVTGNFEITLGGESGGGTTTYTIHKNSFIRYRAVPAL